MKWVSITGIIAIAAVEVVALYFGVDGSSLNAAVLAISGIAGIQGYTTIKNNGNGAVVANGTTPKQ